MVHKDINLKSSQKSFLTIWYTYVGLVKFKQAQMCLQINPKYYQQIFAKFYFSNFLNAALGHSQRDAFTDAEQKAGYSYTITFLELVVKKLFIILNAYGGNC